jgi:hypothetical protein
MNLFFKEDSMIKRSLIFVLIAVLSAIFVLTGCPTDGGDDTPQTVAPGTGVVIDKTVNEEGDLDEAMKADNVETVAFVLSKDENLSTLTVIPYGKTLYLLNHEDGRRTVTPSASGLNIRGTLIVSENTGLKADAAHQLSLWSTGSIQVQADGLLITDKRLSVTNYTDAGVGKESVLFKNVRYTGGSTLTLTNEEKLTIGEINEMLAFLELGTVSRALSTDTGPSKLVLEKPLVNVKLSDLTQIAGTSKQRAIEVKPGLAETQDAITIPAGVEVSFAPDYLLTGIKTLVVEGAFTADSIGGDANIAVTVAAGGKLDVKDPIKFDNASKIAAGADFIGTSSDGKIPADAGATVNGVAVKEGEVITILSGEPGSPITVEKGAKYQVKGDVTLKATLTVQADGTLLIPEGTSLTVGDAGSIIANGTENTEGTIIVQGTLVGPEDDSKFIKIRKIEGDGVFKQTLTETYKLADKDGSTEVTKAENYERTAIKETRSTGVPTVSITVTSKTNKKAPAADKGAWGDAGDAKPKTGVFSDLAVDLGAVVTAPTTVTYAIKNTNIALLYYAGTKYLGDGKENADGALFVTHNRITAPQPENKPDVYISSDNTSEAYKWKLYVPETQFDTDQTGFGVLIWENAPSKIITLEVSEQVAGGGWKDLVKVVINYTAVEFATTP